MPFLKYDTIIAHDALTHCRPLLVVRSIFAAFTADKGAMKAEDFFRLEGQWEKMHQNLAIDVTD